MGQDETGLTDEQISILVDIGTDGGAGMNPDKLSEMLGLVANGYIEGDDGKPNHYKLTAKSLKVLEERGVGANES